MEQEKGDPPWISIPLDGFLHTLMVLHLNTWAVTYIRCSSDAASLLHVGESKTTCKSVRFQAPLKLFFERLELVHIDFCKLDKEERWFLFDTIWHCFMALTFCREQVRKKNRTCLLAVHQRMIQHLASQNIVIVLIWSTADCKLTTVSQDFSLLIMWTGLFSLE